MTKDQVLSQLQLLAEPSYKTFSEKLAPSSRPLLGVRVPAIRKLAKEIAREDWQEYLKHAGSDTFEEVLLQGFVIGYAKMDNKQRLELIASFVPLIDGWSICDSTCASFTAARKYPEEFWEFLLPYLDSTDPWAIRFGIVMLMDHFIDAKHIDFFLEYLRKLDNPHHYVQMGAGWALSVCYVKFRDKTHVILEDATLNPGIRKKAIQKCIESYRVSEQDKQILRDIRKTIGSEPLNIS